MTHEEIDKCVKHWMNYTKTCIDGSREDKEKLESPFYKRSWESVFETSETWWQFLLIASEIEMSDMLWSNLAAGPMEEFLCDNGPEYLGRIEKQAQTNSKFKDLLGGVWQNRMKDDLWQKIVDLRGEQW